MFEKIINFSIRNKLVIGIMTLLLIVWGAVSLSQLPFDSTPDITNNQVQVITQAPTLGAEEVEQYVTTPLEMAFANIPDIVERRSISRSGLSVVTLVFRDNVDIYWARQQVSQQLKEAEEEIPRGAGKVSLLLSPLDSARFTNTPFIQRKDMRKNSLYQTSVPYKTGLYESSLLVQKVWPR